MEDHVVVSSWQADYLLCSVGVPVRSTNVRCDVDCQRSAIVTPSARETVAGRKKKHVGRVVGGNVSG